jgi:hypothetical protein
MRLPGAALQAVAAGNVHLRRNKVPHRKPLYALTERRDGAAELVAGDIGRLDAILGPVVPVEDVQVRAADAGSLNGDENVGRSAGRGLRASPCRVLRWP